ncbi:hypothetical protein [Ureibacillus sp. GCM10028918]|uniref:hypothetical protein n=1 Tax=Ureibacillus sp. GCM10028918 TaxID=3273429 RepID=UPI00360F73AA
MELPKRNDEHVGKHTRLVDSIPTIDLLILSNGNSITYWNVLQHFLKTMLDQHENAKEKWQYSNVSKGYDTEYSAEKT